MDIGELTLNQVKELKAMNLSAKETSEFNELIGTKPTFYAMNYIYTGTVVSVVGGSINLGPDAMIVYDTGSHKDVIWEDAESMPNGWSILIQSLESYGIFK
jgi:hypothetical protein